MADTDTNFIGLFTSYVGIGHFSDVINHEGRKILNCEPFPNGVFGYDLDVLPSQTEQTS